MKRILLTVVCVIITFFAQADGHMMFKGVEIDGDVESFKTKLAKQGFSGLVQDGAGIMTGSFTGEEVMLAFYATPLTKLVYSVVVIYQPQSQWSLLENKYSGLVESLKKKYGEPKESIWDVDKYSEPKHELMMDRATIITRFECENGGVSTGIRNLPEFGLVVFITYWDKENDALNNAEVESDL